MTSEAVARLPAPHARGEGEDEIDLGRIFALLWGGKWTILLAICVAVLLACLYLAAARPVYSADGTVQVEQNEKGGGLSPMGDLGLMFGTPTVTEAEIQILQSRMILTKVVETLNLQISAEPRYFPIIGGFIARRRAGLDEPAPPFLGLGDFAWGGEAIEVSTLALSEDFLGQELLLIAGDNGQYQLFDPNGKLLLNGKVGVAATQGDVQIFIRELKARAGTQFKLTGYSLASALNGLIGSLTVTQQGKQSGVIGLTFEDFSAERAAAVVRQIEDAYLRQNVERRSAEAQKSLEFLQQQLPDIRARVDAAQARLNAYQMRQGSVNVTKETDLVLQQSVDLETKRLELQQQRQQALQRFTTQHPTIQAIDAQIRGIESEQNQIKERSSMLPETQQEVLSLMRDLEVNTQLYTTLLNSAQELQVAKAGTVGNVRIIDYPLVPRNKTKPKSSLILAASVVLGGFLGVALLFLRRALFHGVSRPEEIESTLGLHTYAAIPFARRQKQLVLAAQKKQAGNHFLAAADPNDIAIESLRSFRTSLQFALMEAPNQIIMFTGPTPGLGKSFVSANLGAVLAASGKKVILIDADLRRGHLHKYIGEDASPGLSDYVAGNADLRSIIRPTSVDGLSLIANGTTPPNPAELLMHERFAQLLDTVAAEFDLVIIDTPPVLPVTDASIVGRLAGSVFMVLKEGEHPLKMVEESVRRLTLAGVQLRGVIFNQVGARGTAYGGYYDGYGYGMYGYSYKNRYSSEKG
ncbi:polysaccharide biosynthesis tyrosine autokinase [Hydrocarboniphaga effusa]|uniref:polysaccharide biosynthesis tyrosine autokinase n=1 Tax=Hydrocarboniphaga effusa TaxID=243629 RepID=UPI00398BD5B2